MTNRGGVLLAVGLLVAGAVWAHGPRDGAVAAPSWGSDQASLLVIHAFEFVPISSNTSYDFDSWMKYSTGGYGSFAAGVALPSGAVIDEVSASVCDEDGAQQLQVRLWRCPHWPTDACVAVAQISPSLTGCGYIRSASLGEIVDNGQSSYFVEVKSNTNTNSHRFRHVAISYQLQVSPAPGVATFGDVPMGHPFFQHIEALAASGITAGCGGGNFCPDQPLTRGQMAVFLSKALGLHWAP